MKTKDIILLGNVLQKIILDGNNLRQFKKQSMLLSKINAVYKRINPILKAYNDSNGEAEMDGEVDINIPKTLAFTYAELDNLDIGFTIQDIEILDSFGLLDEL